MDGMVIGEKEKINWCEAELQIKGSDGSDFGASGRFFLSNFRVIFESEQGYFEESLEMVGVTGTVKVKEELSLMVQFMTENSFTWYIKFLEDSIVKDAYTKLTTCLDELERHGNKTS